MLSHVPLLAAIWTGACQDPLSLEFSRQEYWTGLPFPLPWEFPNKQLNHISYAFCIGRRFFTTETPLNLAREYSSNYNLVSVEFWSLQSAFTALGEDEQFSSVQFSHSVMSDSLWPHELQHARLPCLSPTARVYPNPCPLSWWCHPAISSSVVLCSSCPQCFPATGSFQMSQLFASRAQVLEFQHQHQSFQWIFRTNFL